MYFFRTFKKSTAPYKVHNMGLRYIKIVSIRVGYQFSQTYTHINYRKLVGNLDFFYTFLLVTKILSCFKKAYNVLAKKDEKLLNFE